jgi:hypothetical protein
MSGRDSGGGCKGSVRPRAAWEGGRVEVEARVEVEGRGPRESTGCRGGRRLVVSKSGAHYGQGDCRDVAEEGEERVWG